MLCIPSGRYIQDVFVYCHLHLEMFDYFFINLLRETEKNPLHLFTYHQIIYLMHIRYSLNNSCSDCQLYRVGIRVKMCCL